MGGGSSGDTLPGGVGRRDSVIRTFLFIAGLGLGALALAVSAGEPPAPSPRIVNGVLESQWPTAGALLAGPNPATASAICSLTLIGCETVLTAAHCVCGKFENGQNCTPNPSSYSVFLQHAGFFNVSSISLRADYNFPVADVAVLKLAAPVSGIAPTPIINTAQSPPFGTPGTIVGFGTRGGASDDSGLKRSGDVVTASCTSGVSNQTSVCWNFENPVGPPGTDSNTCFGDSGGPLYIDFGSGPVVAGVTSGGDNPTCLALDASFDANVHFYRSWIQAEGGADLSNTTCGTISQVESPGATVQSASGTLSNSNPDDMHAFTAPVGVTLLRFAMNADNDRNDFDLFVKAGSPPTTGDFDCKQNGRGQLGFCEFASPPSGSWFVLIDRSSGAGEYQITVTAFTSNCEEPGSEGLLCDDDDPCTDPDTCQSGLCVGTPLLDGTSCEDGSLCTLGDTCQGGTCTSGDGPALSCRTPTIPGTSRLLVLDKPNDKFNRLVWRWRKGEATTLADFGTPNGDTDYALCIYDLVLGTPNLVSETVIPGGANWLQFPNRWRYADPTKSQGGTRRVILKEGTHGTSRIIFRAVGVNVDLASLPMAQSPRVLVQLLNENLCWEAEYSTSIRNDFARFKALSD